ncbi:jg3457 [Pararge aegeria aegeria]|uniref:Jg3457 protein n=1 Tax=Pararge aegeria aegeria TaxID=348720 RepID=A0A8S4RA54_9NEOP|nr:jg3457 [Pararge aegeria aegeria]
MHLILSNGLYYGRLLEMGTPKHLVHLYEDGTASVKTDQNFSDHFQPKAGLRQGCIISLLLFTVFTELIMKRNLQNWTDGVVIRGLKISNVRYADDTTLFASSVACSVCIWPQD